MEIIILGPTSSGKSLLAKYLASIFHMCVFNCDSIQIYEDLNILSNKPTFTKKISVKEEIICLTELLESNEASLIFNRQPYQNIEIIVYEYVNERIVNEKFEDFIEGVEFIKMRLNDLVHSPSIYDTNLNEFIDFKSNIAHFLFDIRRPFENYSPYDFEKDVRRISYKFDLLNKIIVGGTVYYAFNYLFRLNKLNYKLIYQENIKNVSEVNYDSLNLREIQNILEAKLATSGKIKEKTRLNLDPYKINNKRTLLKLIYLLDSNLDLEKFYYKKPRLRKNCLIVLLIPKDIGIFYEYLKSIVLKRVNLDSIGEIEFLLNKWGAVVLNWLSKISYEYRHFINLYEIYKKQSSLNLHHQKVNEVISLLQKDERHYVKRQFTFIRRLIRWINNIKLNLE